MNTQDFVKMFDDANHSVQLLGRAKPGEKTMVDALDAASQSLWKNENLNEKEALEKAFHAAQVAAESTKNMLATKGRGRYQKEKSIGFQDPGATSVSLLLKAIWEIL